MATFRDLLARGVKSRWILYIVSMAAANIFAGAVATALLRWVLPIQRDAYVVDNRVLIYGSALAYLAVGAVVSMS
ncbi:MAG: hypothetical protein L0H59_07115, partial [Tomitella sp.]|nr:hypothetical protein [Tomitella sp.]